MISALGLRYAPSAAADRQHHAAKFALLADDLADVNPGKLKLAIDRWVSFKPFPPKASELRAIIESFDDAQLGANELQDWCDERNAWARRIGADWWYHVRNVELNDGTKRFEVHKLEGWRAIEARAHAEGRRIEWFKPTDDEAAQIHAKVARIIAANPGMTQSEFNRLVDQGRI